MWTEGLLGTISSIWFKACKLVSPHYNDSNVTFRVHITVKLRFQTPIYSAWEFPRNHFGLMAVWCQDIYNICTDQADGIFILGHCRLHCSELLALGFLEFIINYLSWKKCRILQLSIVKCKAKREKIQQWVEISSILKDVYTSAIPHNPILGYVVLMSVIKGMWWITKCVNIIWDKSDIRPSYDVKG